MRAPSPAIDAEAAAARAALPWPSEGLWLRCALHAHTTESDGELRPDDLALHYERGGYDVLATTDHGKRTEAQGRRILVLPSAELAFVSADGRRGHLLAFGLRCQPGEPAELAAEQADLPRVADWVEARGGVAYLAHPYWSGLPLGSLDLPANVVGIEVYNAGCELEAGRGLSSVHWDELAERGRLCPGIATDDSHHPGFDSDLAWTWLRVPERSPEGVLAALSQGSLYASCGPLLHEVARDGDTVEVRSSPCRSVTLVSDSTLGSAVNAGRLGYVHGGQALEEDASGLIVRARLDIPRGARYVRVEVTDAEGRKAWASPFRV